MKERPILFNDEMVRAILDGRKTQTRRVVKLNAAGRASEIGSHRNWHLEDPDAVSACPYGQPGDRLWVREAWKYADWTEQGEPFIQYRADGAELIGDFPEEWADRLSDEWALLSEPANYQIDNRAADRRWRPSIHMPRWASRIDLEVVSVRVERVQEISHTDCMAEGVRIYTFEATGDHPRMYGFITDADGPDEHGTAPHHSSKDAYAKLWDSINAKRGYSWESNPWVWVVEFKRVKA